MIVVKIGGNAGVEFGDVLDDVASRAASGSRVVLVHGCSDAATRLQEALGQAPRFVTSPSGYPSRFTDRAALDVLVTAAAGVNATLVEGLRARGVDAVGLSGMDGGLWRGPRKTAIRAVEDGRTVVLRDGYTGRVRDVDAGLLEALLERGRVPVVGPPAWADDGVPVNVDADRAAAATAGALGAEALVILSNVPGLLADVDDAGSLVREVTGDAFDAAMALAKGRMRTKMLAAREALDRGVGRVVLAAAGEAGPIEAALGGGGTTLVAAELAS